MYFKIPKRIWMYALNAGLFQLGWMLCVLGGDRVALISLLILLVLHQWLFRATLNEWLLIGGISVFGAVVDSLLIYANLFRLDAQEIGGISLAPVWLLCLWVMFTTTLCHSLAPLCHSRWLTCIVAAIGVPWSYWCGAYLKDIILPWQGLFSIALIWLLWFPLVMHFIVRKLVIRASDTQYEIPAST